MNPYLNYTFNQTPFQTQNLTPLHWESLQAVKEERLEQFLEEAGADTLRLICVVKCLSELESQGILSVTGEKIKYSVWKEKNGVVEAEPAYDSTPTKKAKKKKPAFPLTPTPVRPPEEDELPQVQELSPEELRAVAPKVGKALTSQVEVKHLETVSPQTSRVEGATKAPSAEEQEEAATPPALSLDDSEDLAGRQEETIDVKETNKAERKGPITLEF